MRHLTLLLCVSLSLTGCSALLERNYATVEPHSSKFWESEAAGTLRAENYQDIVNALLILIGQQSDLRLIAEGGIALDAKVSTSLLKNIFFKNAPLHDGAVLIEGDRIVAAKCILPVTQSDVPKSYGPRHRAAIGMSEISDAIIIVVSEETGGISIAQGGELRRNIDPVRLQQTLQRYLTINTRKRSKKEVAE